jgi:hypothetical protein
MHQRNTCPCLNSLATLLREKYDLRDKVIGRNYAIADLSKTENDLIQAQRAVTRHRLHCPECQMHHRFGTAANMRRRPLQGKVQVSMLSISAAS